MGMADPPGSGLHGEIAILLRRVGGDDAQWPADIAPTTRLEGDLLLDSIELAAFSELLRARYGDGVDLVAYVADLDLDQIIALTIADVARYVEARSRPATAEASER